MQYLTIYTSSLPDLLSLGTFEMITMQLLTNCTASYCAIKEMSGKSVPQLLRIIKEGVLKVNILKNDEDAVIHSATQEMLENTVVYRFKDTVDLSIFGDGSVIDTFFLSSDGSASLMGVRAHCRVMKDE